MHFEAIWACFFDEGNIGKWLYRDYNCMSHLAGWGWAGAACPLLLIASGTTGSVNLLCM